MIAFTEPQMDRLIQAVESLVSSHETQPALYVGLLATGVYSLAGVILALLAYKVFDLCTPGNLHQEILENKNVAAAVIGGAVIIGVSVIVAAAIQG